MSVWTVPLKSNWHVNFQLCQAKFPPSEELTTPPLFSLVYIVPSLSASAPCTINCGASAWTRHIVIPPNCEIREQSLANYPLSFPCSRTVINFQTFSFSDIIKRIFASMLAVIQKPLSMQAHGYSCCHSNDGSPQCQMLPGHFEIGRLIIYQL